MSNPYVGEIILVGFNFAPAGWAFCNGQLLPISENETLFQLIGTTYGGDGQTTFGLPDLRGTHPHRSRPGPRHAELLPRRERRHRDDHADHRATGCAYARHRHQHVHGARRGARTDRETSGRRWGTCTRSKRPASRCRTAAPRRMAAMNVNPLAVSGSITVAPAGGTERARQHAAVPDDELLHLALWRLPKRNRDRLLREPMPHREPVPNPLRRVRQLAWMALVFLFVQAASIPSAFATDYTVTKTDDTNDGVCDSDCSLREAIVAANANPGADRVSSAPARRTRCRSVRSIRQERSGLATAIST